MRNAGVVLFAAVILALSLVMTYPLATDLAGQVAGPPGDNFEYVYKLWWFKHALLERGESPFFIRQVFYPFGYDVALSETTLANTILGLPLTAAVGDVAAYNLLLLWSFVLSGLGAFLLARHLHGSIAAACLAGVVFAFLPYRTSHVATGHLPLMATGWLPFLLLYEDRLLRAHRLRDGVLTGLFYGLFALSSWYYAYMGALAAVLYAVIFMAATRRGRQWRRLIASPSLWRGVLAASIVAGLLIAPAAVPLLGLAGAGEITRTTTSMRYVDQWSASLGDFVLPSIMHPLWGERLITLYPQNVHENVLWLGFLPLALSIYAVWKHRSVTVVVYAVIGVIATVLALGTTWHWAGEPVYIPVPGPVEDIFARLMYALSGKYALNPAAYSSLHQAGHIVIPLPTLALYLFLPFFNAMRVWARFGLIVGLVVAQLAAQGLDGLLRSLRSLHRSARSQAIAAVLVIVWVVFEFATVPYPFGVSAIGPQPVDEWLRWQSDDTAVLMLPPEKTWHGPALYAQKEHGKAIAYGYGTYMPTAYRAWQQVLAGFPDSASLSAIEKAGIRYVLVGIRSYGDDEQEMRRRLAAQPRLRLMHTFEERPVLSGDRLMNLVRPSPVVPPSELIGSVRFAYLVDQILVYEIIE